MPNHTTHTEPPNDGDRLPDRLTLDILSALAQGMNTTDAAATCNVSLSTLRRRLDDLRHLWGLEHNVELVVHAVRAGLI